MSSDQFPYPVAVSRLSQEEAPQELQVQRAIAWLRQQQGGPIVVVTPQKRFSNDNLRRLIESPGVAHHSWKGFSTGSLVGHRVLYAWPDRKHLNDLWGVQMDALVVLEWIEHQTREWVEDALPVELPSSRPPERLDAEAEAEQRESLPNGVEGILEYIASRAAGYSTGLKWNEEEKLKADMMNRPDRWQPITVAQVRGKCRELHMRPNDIDTVAGLLQRRKDRRRFNVKQSYRDYKFPEP